MSFNPCVLWVVAYVLCKNQVHAKYIQRFKPAIYPAHGLHPKTALSPPVPQSRLCAAYAVLHLLCGIPSYQAKRTCSRWAESSSFSIPS